MSSKVNILVAYPYMKANVVHYLHENQDDIQFLLDSGAFTAWKAGKPIVLDDYCRFLEKLPLRPWRYFALDVIGDARRTMDNYELMLKRGFNPVPVFTRGEDPAVIDDYYKTSDMVGIGGLVGTRGAAGFVKGIMGRIGTRKVHWLGFNKKEFIAYYRPYSCDSSSFASGVRYACIALYDRFGRWIPVKKENFIEKPSQEILRLIHEYGLDPFDFAKTFHWRNSGKNQCALENLAYRSWVKYQLDLFKRLRVNFHLACGTENQVRGMVESYHFWKGKL